MLTRDLLRAKLSKGSDYSSKDVCEFMQPISDEYMDDYPDIPLLLRGDSGFAVPDLYGQCETNGTSYVIRLKENVVLRKLASGLEAKLAETTESNMVDYAVVYGDLYYQAGSWDYPRRVVCKVEKPTGQMIHIHTFIFTNMDSSPERLIKFYCKRGSMEDFIKEGKNDFDFAAVSSSTEIVNANRFQLHALAYNLFNGFRRLALPESLRSCLVDTILLKLIKIATKVVRSARRVIFKLCISCPYKDEFI